MPKGFYALYFAVRDPRVPRYVKAVVHDLEADIGGVGPVAEIADFVDHEDRGCV